MNVSTGVSLSTLHLSSTSDDDSESDSLTSFKPADPIQWHDRELPSWAYDDSAVQVISCVMEWKAPALVRVGAASTRVLAFVWRYVFYAMLVVWFFWAAFPLVVANFATCDEQGGFSRISAKLLIIYVPFVLLSLWLECKVLAAKIPMEVCSLGGWTFLGVRVPFSAYFGVQLVVSAVSHMDLATNGIVYAEILHTASCDGNRVDETWALVSQRSVFHERLPRLSAVASISYGLMVVQLLYALYTGLPLFTNSNPRVKSLSEWLTMKAPVMHSKDDLPQSPYAITLQSWSEEVWATELVMSLSPAARLTAVMARETERVKVTELAKVQQLSGADPWTRASLVTWARLITQRLFLTACFEGALFTNITGSVLAIEKYLTGRADILTLASVVLSSLMFAERLISTVKVVRAVTVVLWPELNDDKASDEDRKFQEQGYEEINRSSLKGYLLRTVTLLLGSAVLLSWWMGYAVLKTLMVFRCSKGLWNYAWPLPDGCIE
ncbi:unnamed protein product [Symbiodinium sp. CCMP2592]|nr:unnamed protein product [Symbiodinium sp. CCMP2592]CAE7035304.1 unnamed protein product [Symbiodinium sp. CCMP2592]